MWTLPKSCRKSMWWCLRGVSMVLVFSQLCPHSWVVSDSCIAPKAESFPHGLLKKHYVNWRRYLASYNRFALLFPAPCLGPSVTQAGVIAPGFCQAANSPYASVGLCHQRQNVLQIFLTVKLNQRWCFSCYVGICWGDFSVVIFILLPMERL